LIQATEAAYDVKPVSTEQEAIDALRDRLVQKGKLNPREWEAAAQTAGKLLQSADERLNETKRHLQSEIGDAGRRFTFGLGYGEGGHEEVAEKTGQQFDLASYNKRVQLGLSLEGSEAALVLFFYGVGPRYRGIIGVVAYLYSKGNEPTILEGGTFQINYEEDLASAQSRFAPWLERMIVEGLNGWRRRL
jgi:hypothetical protein